MSHTYFESFASAPVALTSARQHLKVGQMITVFGAKAVRRNQALLNILFNILLKRPMVLNP